MRRPETSAMVKVANTTEAKEVSRYSVDGQQLATPAKGLNIVKYNDGTTRKVMVK